jgi:oligopeptide/dipeptide ABC transporter ATP-binding protein
MSEALLSVEGLTKHFRLEAKGLFEKGPLLRAVDGIDFTLERGETLGLVGESGCGKSTTARLVLRLIEATSGSVMFGGTDVLNCSGTELRQLRREMQLVFQDPLASLNPRMSVGVSIAEPLRFHAIGSQIERFQQAREFLEVVGLSADYFDRLPHEFSGGQNQRVAIARALILQPKLVILDEPVSALDVSIRAQILNLLRDLQNQFHLTFMFISHDLSVVKHFCDRTCVLYLGKIVEIADSELLYREPLHPYTQALIEAVPASDLDTPGVTERAGLEGDIPSPIDPPSGCRFHTRCPKRMDRCSQAEPQLREVRPGHRVACFLTE